FPVVSVKEKIAGHFQDAWMQVETIEVGRRGWWSTFTHQVFPLLPESPDEAVENPDHLPATAHCVIDNILLVHVRKQCPSPELDVLMLVEFGRIRTKHLAYGLAHVASDGVVGTCIVEDSRFHIKLLQIPN